MNLVQRIILCLGWNALVWIWVHPPVYRLTAGDRLERNIFYAWEVPMDWSVNLPMIALRMATVVLVSAGMYGVFSGLRRKEAAS